MGYRRGRTRASSKKQPKGKRYGSSQKRIDVRKRGRIPAPKRPLGSPYGSHWQRATGCGWPKAVKRVSYRQAGLEKQVHLATAEAVSWRRRAESWGILISAANNEQPSSSLRNSEICRSQNMKLKTITEGLRLLLDES